MTDKPFIWEAWLGQTVKACQSESRNGKTFIRIILEDGRGIVVEAASIGYFHEVAI